MRNALNWNSDLKPSLTSSRFFVVSFHNTCICEVIDLEIKHCKHNHMLLIPTVNSRIVDIGIG
jgi:hypothetical protein